MFSLGAFLDVHSFTTIPSAISTQPTAFSLIHFPNPMFQHSAPTSISELPSQAGVPMADSQGSFGMCGTQARRALMGEGDFSPREEWGTSDEGSSSCPQRLKKLLVGEMGYNDGSAPCMPLNDALLLWYLRFFLQIFPAVELLTPVPSDSLFTANSCLLSGSTLQTPLSSTQTPFTTGDS